jgi:hypothetical protein
MSVPSDFQKEAARLRQLAGRARRLATQLSTEQDRQRLERYADELERDAAALDGRQPGGGSPRE